MRLRFLLTHRSDDLRIVRLVEAVNAGTYRCNPRGLHVRICEILEEGNLLPADRAFLNHHRCLCEQRFAGRPHHQDTADPITLSIQRAAYTIKKLVDEAASVPLHGGIADGE